MNVVFARMLMGIILCVMITITTSAQEYSVNLISTVGNCTYQGKMIVLYEVQSDRNVPLDTVSFIGEDGVFSFHQDTLYVAQKLVGLDGVVIKLDKFAIMGRRMIVKEEMFVDDMMLASVQNTTIDSTRISMDANQFLYWSHICFRKNELVLLAPDREFVYDCTEGKSTMLERSEYW